MELNNFLSEKRKKIAEERMNICQTCVYYRPLTTQCAKCGCFMKFKTMLMRASCPKGKWESHKEGEEEWINGKN